MKTILCSLLLCFVATILRSDAAIVAPVIGLVDTSVDRHNFHEASFQITLRITAPVDNDIFLDRTATPLNLNLYGDPGDGTRWEFVDAPGSPPRPAMLYNHVYARISGSTSGDTAQLWRIPAGSSAEFRLSMEVSLNPFEENPPTRLLALKMTHVNWDGDNSTTEAALFTALVPEYQTDYVVLGPAPEPSASLLGIVGICTLLARRRRTPDHR